MNKHFKTPPKEPSFLTTINLLQSRLKILIGHKINLTGKSRTDGSNIRKLIASTLEQYELPELALEDEYEIVPLKKKGIPKITREFIDTYIVTSGNSYNLQVWNRIPASNSLLIKYENGTSLKCKDVRFILVKVDIQKKEISSIAILSADYIVKQFGKFGKPTIKYQLLISSKSRKEIIKSKEKILTFRDTTKMTYLLQGDIDPPKSSFAKEPSFNEIYSIALLKKIVAEKLIGYKLDAAATKNRGQALERKVLELLGYQLTEKELLFGGYPDIKNQLLEIKVQDSPTVDLGKYTPEFEEIIVEELKLTTKDVRYLIALTNPETEIIEGIILSPGEKLGEIFSYVSSKSYKCQRSIPMSFFEKHKGKIVINPD